jgi:replication initiation protein RepC
MPVLSTTRWSLTPAYVATQMAAANRPPEKTAQKSQVFRAICGARPKLSVSEPALVALNAPLSFYPETTLTGEDDLIVFPSNEQLYLRTHGMADSTMRRRAALVDAGMIVRRDSPNGKRYARKGRVGAIKLGFGFEPTPLVARAEEFQRLAVSADLRPPGPPNSPCQRARSSRRHKKTFRDPVLVRATRRLQSRSPKRNGGQ